MYCDDMFSKRNFEKFMQTIPNFAPRGHGLYISKSELTLYENQNSPPVSLSDAIKKTMSAINYPPFQRRLEQYLKESEEKTMYYRNEKHRIAFTKAIEKMNKKDYALMSAIIIYILCLLVCSVFSISRYSVLLYCRTDAHTQKRHQRRQDSTGNQVCTFACI